ncbi:MAG: hypothetical protein DRI57_21070, partial [Deltaproteobacteria bacterium]
IYIIEFKCNRSAQAGIDQILKKKYADKYKQRGKKIILMGINFDSEKRNVSEWKKSDLIEETEPSSPDTALQHT